ncbi:MAG: group I truncated hemoglobin [Phycisphaerae bacterium]
MRHQSVLRSVRFLAVLPTALAVAVLLGGCAKSPSNMAAPSLYSQLGGQQGITTVVHAFLINVSKDPRINGRFAHANIAELQTALVNQIGQLSGGPQVYTGPDMYQAHKGMHITDAQWNAFMEDFSDTLKEEHVTPVAQQELIDLLAPMKSDIVGH